MADTKLSDLFIASPVTPLATDLAYLVRTSLGTAGSVASELSSIATLFGTALFPDFVDTPATILTATVPLLVNESSATAFQVGPNGATDPTLKVVTNTASGATGLSITNAASGSGVTLTAMGGTNESISLVPKGTAGINVGAGATGTDYSFRVQPTSGGTVGKTVIIQDATASSGVTRVKIKAGEGQSGTIFEIRDATDSLNASILDGGSVRVSHSNASLSVWTTSFSANAAQIRSTTSSDEKIGLSLASVAYISFSNSTNAYEAKDTSISKISAGLVGIGTGAQGSFAGSLKLTDLTATGIVDGASYKVGGAAGVDFSGSGAAFAALTTVTFVKGILTVAS